MIARSDVLAGVHAMLDHLQNAGSPQDYYRINSTSADKISGLVDATVAWLRMLDVDSDEP
jgi:hypothetical protein